MPNTQPILAGEAVISVYVQGAATLDNPIFKDLIVNELEMMPEYQIISRHVTGASAVKHNPILTHYVIKWTANEALLPSQIFRSPQVGRYVMDVVWLPDISFDGRWRRRIFKDVTLASDTLVSEAALQMMSKMTWNAESVVDSAWSATQQTPPDITTSDIS